MISDIENDDNSFEITYQHTDKLFIATQEYVGKDREDPLSAQFQGVFYLEEEPFNWTVGGPKWPKGTFKYY